MSYYSLTNITGGLYPSSQNDQTGLLTGGLQSLFFNTGLPTNTAESIGTAAVAASALTSLIAGPNSGISKDVNQGIAIASSAVNAIANIVGLPAGSIFNPYGSLPGQSQENSQTTYTGSDLRVLIQPVNTATTSNTNPFSQQLIQCTTITVSVHREKAPVRAAGYIGPKAFARGKRTIAGTMILTQFTVDALYTFLMAGQINAHDLSKDTQYLKVDQLPPFNITLLFADEFGNASYRRILGVDFVTDGVVYSSNDLISEQTVSYMASDFTPLLTINDSPNFTPDIFSQLAQSNKTVQTVLSAANQVVGTVSSIYNTVNSIVGRF